MSSPVAQSAHSKVKPTTPLPIYKIFTVMMSQGLHLPDFPIQCFRNSLWVWKSSNIMVPSMPPPGAVHVSIYSCNIFNNTSVFPSLILEIIGFGVSLISHLCRKFWILPSLGHHQFNLIERSCHWFFNIYMFAL